MSSGNNGTTNNSKTIRYYRYIKEYVWNDAQMVKEIKLDSDGNAKYSTKVLVNGHDEETYVENDNESEFNNNYNFDEEKFSLVSKKNYN